MPPQTQFFFDLWKISFEHGARLQSRQLERLMALQFRLAESQLEHVMNFWSRAWRAAADNRATRKR